ncbi:exonuclease SbcCD subunit D, partial [candidate division KSB1 bacterium]
MQPFTFIHAADLHLDCPFKELHAVSDLPGAGASPKIQGVNTRIRNATFTAFDNLISLTLERNADFLLISGDLYDSQNRSLRAQLAFRDGMKRLAERDIPVYVVHGNHDPVLTDAPAVRLPDNVHIFDYSSPESLVFRKNGTPCTVIHGISYANREETRNLSRLLAPAGRTIKEDDQGSQLDITGEGHSGPLFHIGLLHCNAGGQSGHEPYAPCSVKDDLIPAGMDYWALGHVHTRTTLHDAHPVIVYPGNTQGLHFRETGARGCCEVCVDTPGEAQVNFHAVDDIRWYSEEINITSHENINNLIDAQETLMEKISADSDGRLALARLTLTGRGPVHSELKGFDSSGAAEDFQPTHHNVIID